jgi:hypothetical protein
MPGWGTIINNNSGKQICFGWITGNPNYSTRRLFEGYIVEKKLKNGYPDTFTIPVERFRMFLNDPAIMNFNLRENVFGPLTYKPFNPQFVLDQISDLSDDDNIMIEEWDES